MKELIEILKRNCSKDECSVIVFDLPASELGAASVLREFYEEARKERNVSWYFVVGKYHLDQDSNIKVYSYPWVKKSWFHRLYFDMTIAPKIVRRLNPDMILSLQSVIIPKVTDVPQILYLHNPLFLFHKKMGISSLLRYLTVGRLIRYSIKKADFIVVQTNWMKNLLIRKFHIEEKRIYTVKPEIHIECNNEKEGTKSQTSQTVHFFYPAGPYFYKNHRTIVKAVEELLKRGIKDFDVIFTLEGNETFHIRRLYKKCLSEQLPIKFVGKLSRSEVAGLYKKSVLIFASYIETFGYPLYEAQICGSPIIAADTPFAREALEGYEKAHFFDPFDHEKLAGIMKQFL